MADIVFPNILSSPPGSYTYTLGDLGLQNAGNNVAGPTDFSTIPTFGDDTLIILFNSTAGSLNFTAESNPDSKFGRSASTAQTVFAIGAGLYRIMGPLKADGWANRTTGIMRMQASAAGIRACVIRMI